MEQMDMSKYLPCTSRLDPLETAIKWFQMSNDAFYALYGVNWVPKEPYYSQARRMLFPGGGRHV